MRLRKARVVCFVLTYAVSRSSQETPSCLSTNKHWLSPGSLKRCSLVPAQGFLVFVRKLLFVSLRSSMLFTCAKQAEAVTACYVVANNTNSKFSIEPHVPETR